MFSAKAIIETLCSNKKDAAALLEYMDKEGIVFIEKKQLAKLEGLYWCIRNVVLDGIEAERD